MLNVFQTRVKEFEEGILPLRNFINNTHVKSLVETTDTFFDGLRTIGLSELFARQYERQSRLVSMSAESKASQEQFKRHNDLGIKRINEAGNKLKGIPKELSSLVDSKALIDILPKLKIQIEDFKFQCTGLEIKGKDVDKLFNSMDSLFTSLEKKGIDGVIDIMGEKMKELISLRNSENRGAVDNFPVWKVAAIVVGIGVWIIAFIHCGIYRCSLEAGLAYFIIFAIAAIVSKFC